MGMLTFRRILAISSIRSPAIGSSNQKGSNWAIHVRLATHHRDFLGPRCRAIDGFRCRLPGEPGGRILLRYREVRGSIG
jgi:hypothetical protein